MYEQTMSSATATLQNLNPLIFTGETIAQILALTTVGDFNVRFDNATVDNTGQLTVPRSAEVVLVASSDAVQTTINTPVNAPVVIFQGKGGINVRIDDGPNVVVPAHGAGITDRVVVGSDGTDRIVIGDTQNTRISLGSGSSVVLTGGGEDTVVAGLGNSTVVGGSGHAIVQLKGNAADYTVSVQNGHAVVTGGVTHKSTDISKIQYVQLDNGQALVFANDAKEASVSTLYHAAFGRDADATGLEFWFNASKAGASLENIANSFIESNEYKAMAQQTDAEFLTGLYQHTFARAGDAAGMDFWTKVLASGISRASVLAGFISDAGASLDGTAAHVEPIVVGSVTVVHNIV